MPPVDRPWQAADYKAATKALRAAAPAAFPRRGAGPSGPVFERMSSDENLAPLRDDAKPPAERLRQAMELGAASGLVFAEYAKAMTGGAKLGSEILGLMAFMVKAQVAMSSLIERVAPTMDAASPTYEAELDRLARMVDGLPASANSVISTLGERGPYATTDLAELARSLEPYLPELIARLEARDRTDAISRLKKLAESERDPALGRALTSLAAKVEESAPTPLKVK
jgi:hypothetical protein